MIWPREPDGSNLVFVLSASLLLTPIQRRRPSAFGAASSDDLKSCAEAIPEAAAAMSAGAPLTSVVLGAC